MRKREVRRVLAHIQDTLIGQVADRRGSGRFIQGRYVGECVDGISREIDRAVGAREDRTSLNGVRVALT
jgi:hypothetical protein